MEFIMVPILFAFLGSICFLTSEIANTIDKNFKKKSINAKVKIVGYDSDGRLHYPIVSIPIGGEYVMVPCSNLWISPSDYPIGTEIKIKYNKKRFLKVYTYEVRLDDAQINEDKYSTFTNIMKVFGTLSLTISIVVFYYFLNN